MTRPITNYMNDLSFLETVRQRTRLRFQGILPQSSQCQTTPDEFFAKQAHVLTGKAGEDVLHQYFNILQLPAELLWSPHLGLEQNECLPIVLMAMTDAWRRLVLPFHGLPWSIFRLVNMNLDDGLHFLRSVGLQAGSCPKCQDPFFGKVA